MKISVNDPGCAPNRGYTSARRMLAALILVFMSGIAASGAAAQTLVESLARSTTSWEGSLLPAYPTGQPEVQILRITIPPRTTLPIHKHPVINAGYMLEGALTVVTERGERLELVAGDTIIEVVDLWHHGRNDTFEPAVILVFYAGLEGTPLSLSEHEAHPH